ncbi:hypothetical protein H0H93_004524, partial [Arthromyces matolae]
MGPSSLAAQSILGSISTLTFQIHFSNSSAAAVRIGNLLGEKNANRARIAGNAGVVQAVLSATLT